MGSGDFNTTDLGFITTTTTVFIVAVIVIVIIMMMMMMMMMYYLHFYYSDHCLGVGVWLFALHSLQPALDAWTFV